VTTWAEVIKTAGLKIISMKGRHQAEQLKKREKAQYMIVL
jgi:hypothetical protein